MKLTKHQIEIVQKVISGDIYDIPSYLRVFEKGKYQKYDIDNLRQRFVNDKNGKKYKVFKEGHSSFITTSKPSTIAGYSINIPQIFPRNKKDISDDEWEYKEAQFIPHIPKVDYQYDDQKFTFDFENEGVFVANSFSDVIDFISIWSYMKHEALILELDKPVSPEEISVAFELVPRLKKSSKTEMPQIMLDGFSPLEYEDAFSHDILDNQPKITALSYATEMWEINEGHLAMCHDFIGKRIYPTSALHSYAAHGYKTADEVDKHRNLSIAVAALIIAILSPLISIILPQPTYYSELEQIQKTLAILQEDIARIELGQLSSDDLRPIIEAISTLKLSVETLPITEASASVASEVSEINELLDKYFSPSDSADMIDSQYNQAP